MVGAPGLWEPQGTEWGLHTKCSVYRPFIFKTVIVLTGLLPPVGTDDCRVAAQRVCMCVCAWSVGAPGLLRTVFSFLLGPAMCAA